MNMLMAISVFMAGVTFRTTTDLDIRDFGAKGDGVSDDTAAFQSAANALRDASRRGHRAFGRRNRSEKGGGAEGPHPRLVIPEGRYRLTDKVIFNRDIFVCGEGEAVIVQENAKSDAFYCFGAYRTRIENLTFRGGRNQIALPTRNCESSNLRIIGCRFFNSSAAAVDSVSLCDLNGDRVSEWNWDKKEDRYFRDARIDDSQRLKRNNHSSLMTVEDCLFDGCKTSIRMHPDGGVVRNCRFRTASDSTGGAICCWNSMHAYGNDFLLRGDSRKQCAFWCDGGRTIFWIESSRVFTEDRSGACVIGGVPIPHNQSAQVTLSDLKTDSGLQPGNALCRWQEGRFPNLVVVRNVRAEGPHSVEAMSFQPELTERVALANRHYTDIPSDLSYSFAVDGCSQNVRAPGGYAARFMRALPKDVCPCFVECPQAPVRKGTVLFATDDGVDCDPKTDDTAAMRRFVARLKASPDSTGVLPATWITVRETLELDGCFTIAGAGVASLDGEGGLDGYFRVPAGAEVVLKGLQTCGGRRMVTVAADGRCRIDSSFAYDQTDAVVKSERGSEFAWDGGVVYSSRLYDGEGRSFIGNVWLRYTPNVAPSEPLKPAAVIVNRGDLEIWDLLGVPCVFDRFAKDFTMEPAKTIYEYRWVDNYGRYHSRAMRYGGEWGGIVPVYHYGRATTIYEGGYAWFWGLSVPHGAVVADTLNPNASCFSVAFPGYRKYLPNIEMLYRDPANGSMHPIKDARFNIVAPLPGTNAVAVGAHVSPDSLEKSRPDYIVYRPRQPRGGKNADPTKRGDCYNDHFQVIWDDARKLYYAFWTQGSGEGYGDMHVCLSKSTDRGKTWSYPKVIAGGEKIAEPKPRAVWQQPMLAKSGRLYCLWNQQVNDEKLHHGLVYGAYSDDAGETWSKPEVNESVPRQFRDDWKGVSLPNWCNWQRPLRLAEDGKFLVACTRHGTGRGEPHRSLAIEFWRFENIDANPEIRDVRISVLSGGKDAIRVPAGDTGRFISEEASIVKLPDGRLFALMRTRNRHPYWVQSRDGGRSWSSPEPLRDEKGVAYLHPCSPCPLYDINGCEAASGEYVAFIHNAYDDSIPPLGRQNRGPVYMIRGRFDPSGSQPVAFGQPQLFSPVAKGNSYYSSYTCAEGEGVLWFAHQKHFLIGRRIR